MSSPGQRRDQAHHRARDPPGGGQVFRRGDELVSRFQFVADHSTTYEVKRLCELVEVERSSYYAWKAAASAHEERAAADARFAIRIRAVHKEDKTCGPPRITAELNDGVSPDQRVNHKRVARVMREHSIVGYRCRRKVRTTIPNLRIRRCPTCSTGTSPHRPRTSVNRGSRTSRDEACRQNGAHHRGFAGPRSRRSPAARAQRGQAARGCVDGRGLGRTRPMSIPSTWPTLMPL